MSNGSRYRAWTCVLFIGLTISATAQAASLHFIIWAETLDPNIGTITDYNRLIDWANTISTNTGLTLNLRTVTSHQLTPKNARTTLHEINPGEDDVVCCIYTGHGANLGNSEWPVFTFLTHTADPYVTFDEVVATLQPLAQRMLLVMSDCCNASIYGSGHIVPPLDTSGDSAQTIANYQRLFLSFHGTIRVTSSEVGQYSLGDSTNGGLFLSTFLNDLQTLANNTANLTWSKILSTTADEVTDMATYYISTGELGDIEAQVPHYVISEEQVAGSTPDLPGGSTDADDTANNGDTSAGASCGAIGPGMLFATAAGLSFMLISRRSWRFLR